LLARLGGSGVDKIGGDGLACVSMTSLANLTGTPANEALSA
jgi:hypothetical protein